MRRVTKLSLLAISIILLGCTREEPSVKPEAGNIVTMTASMPDDANTPSTKVNLEQDNLNVKLTWDVGDQFYLLFLENGVPKARITLFLTYKDIIAGGKKAILRFALPAALTADKFDIYGVYGGGGFEKDGYNVMLPTAAQSTAGTLYELQERNVIMLKFSKTDIPRNNPQFSVSFSHLGSLFHIELKNRSANNTPLNNISKVELVSSSAIQANQNSGSATYNLVTGAFTNTSIVGTSLPFDRYTPENLEVGGTLDFWGWYPPDTGNWPALSLRVTAAGVPYTSLDTKAARSTAIAAGKVYHLYANYDGAHVYFLTSGVEGVLIDSRDNNVYKTITIGHQVWMAENLKYLPSVNRLVDESATEARYYVYDYCSGWSDTGQNVADAKATTNYSIYGALYNWPAAMNGATYSDTNPSGVQGICPTGWHLPSDAEWTQLINFLGEYTAVYALEEAGETYWTNRYFGATNSSGFTALPGGKRTGGYPSCEHIGESCSLWSTTQSSVPDETYPLGLMLDNNGLIIRGQIYMAQGVSVRCVRDLEFN